MRKNIVAGNWKMNTNLQEGIALAAEVNQMVKAGISDENTGVIIAPPFTHLAAVSTAIRGSQILLAAQNCSDQKSGAYTGEVSAEMLKSLGVDAVILGHSERRSYYGETNETLSKKTQLVLANGMLPIFCIGEVLDERNAGKHFDVVKSQIAEVLFKLNETDFRKVVIAYEPVWAIGTGVTASDDQAQEMHAFIRSLLAEHFGKKVADDTTILYGGSCKPSNSKELFARPDVDGGLIGGAALKAADFMAIVNSF